MISKVNNKKIQELTNALLLLENYDEAKRFLRDLLTEKELIEFGNRWKSARMLYKKIPYTKITKETGLSSATIARVSKWLFRKKSGYEQIIKKLHNNHHRNTNRKEDCLHFN